MIRMDELLEASSTVRWPGEERSEKGRKEGQAEGPIESMPDVARLALEQVQARLGLAG